MVQADDHDGGTPAQSPDQEWLQNYISEHQGQIEPGTRIRPPQKKKPEVFFLSIAAFVMVVALGAVLFLKTQNKAPQGSNSAGDLGQAVSVESGLRGHLVTEFRDKTVHYKLKIEPINLPEQDDFVRVVSSNAMQLYFNLRILNQVGDTICGKQVVLPGGGGGAAAGADALQRVKDARGLVGSLWAEGTLPCTPEQFARFSYWDFTTNFPTVAEQDRGIAINHSVQAENPDTHAAAQTPKPASRARRAEPKKPQAVFYLQGDDHASSFEPGRNILTIGPGRSFVVLRAADLATAAAWADDSALVHYTCDPQATCALRRSGSAVVIIARRSN